ncbi:MULTISPECIES: hypothetical protein [unclassified Streptomyces]|uniref:hypothetical protein n=1 Tax=unclassified Streptomyces TaxID=2593676 RepID=UPI0036649740
MSEFVAIANIEEVFTGRRVIPTITLWNRLEGRPRRHDFDRALKAEVRDALWMLTKQWQMGELTGDDAGSPVLAQVHLDTTRLTKYRPGAGYVEPFDDDVPLEAKVERRPLVFAQRDHLMAFDLRAELGRRWLKLVVGIEPGLREKFITALGFPEPDPGDRGQAAVCAHRETWQGLAALAGRAMDGYALYEYLTAAPGNHAHDLVTLGVPSHAGAVETAETEFLAWYARSFYQPAERDAWIPERLEYSFETAAPRDGGEQHLVADDYFHGHLDWYNLDHAPDGTGLGEVPGAPLLDDVQAEHTATFLPTPISFAGMPNTRWWTFEDGTTSFGDIDPDTTEINKLLVMEFGLVYANDWFLLPLTVPAGAIARIRGLSVTNVFGERTWVEAAGRGSDEDWQRWTMFTLATRGSADIPADLSLLVLPSAPKIQEGASLEEVELVRDELANMVWGIETRVPTPDGDGRDGRMAARETRAFHERLVEQANPTPVEDTRSLVNDATIRYEVMSRVAENWIPFVPVHVEGGSREVQLRRAAVPRLIEGDMEPTVRIRPRTSLLRPGLNESPPKGYDLHEEEVPRAGVQVTTGFQRTRWYGGEAFVWLGARKRTGRGERSSGLAFDRYRPMSG